VQISISQSTDFISQSTDFISQCTDFISQSTDFISQSTDFHFAKYRLDFVLFRFAKYHFAKYYKPRHPRFLRHFEFSGGLPILVPIALFSSLSRQGPGARIEGHWRQRRYTIFPSKILGLRYVSTYTVWDCQWRPLSEGSRNLCGLCVNLENVSLRVGQKEV